MSGRRCVRSPGRLTPCHDRHPKPQRLKRVSTISAQAQKVATSPLGHPLCSIRLFALSSSLPTVILTESVRKVDASRRTLSGQVAETGCRGSRDQLLHNSAIAGCHTHT